MPVKIVVVDDNSFLIKTVKEKLSFFEDLLCKYTAIQGEDLLEKLEKDHLVDLILMDIEMPQLNGIEATAHVKKKYPQIKIIMLTVFDNDEHIFKAIKAGADGYLLKDINAQDLHDGILDTMNGGAAMNPSIALKTLKLLREPMELEVGNGQEEITLTKREIDVLEQLSKGLSYIQISDNLLISSGTVRKHIENIYKKLQVHNKLEAVQKAKNNKLI
ncbi:response regulator transcription factor [Mangrovimonas sp. ST2L15]|uniref:response regulator n=1 Tax=Mangrovimonas sp. ST2L15 TaxID=1645916 RepID=UPI0006B69294|nr:response regulator transcription factor [Mangrovimonas sp. ST2L15]